MCDSLWQEEGGGEHATSHFLNFVTWFDFCFEGFINSLLHFRYFYSSSSRPLGLLLRGASDHVLHSYCVGVNTPKRYRQL